MFERFTAEARQAVVDAQDEARRSATTGSAASTCCSG